MIALCYGVCSPGPQRQMLHLEFGSYNAENMKDPKDNLYGGGYLPRSVLTQSFHLALFAFFFSRFWCPWFPLFFVFLALLYGRDLLPPLLRLIPSGLSPPRAVVLASTALVSLRDHCVACLYREVGVVIHQGWVVMMMMGG